MGFKQSLTSASGEAGPSKKARLNHTTERRPINLPSASAVELERQKYNSAKPYRHASIGGLFDDDLLESVVRESRTYGVRGEEGSLPGWGWEQKETDIYKIQQTPDLASLDPQHLPDSTLASLSHLRRVRDAIYSSQFRQFVRDVTGCGPLSGLKTDGSVGLYTKGSHLLLHDDSISTRRISYILYLPNSPPTQSDLSSSGGSLRRDASFSKGWDPDWGGSLELYPVENGNEGGPPGVKRATKIDVKWGQIVLFEVQPGRSYHAVEEVIIGDGHDRLGISGWFHRPVEGEDGYEPQHVDKEQLSSLAQITSVPSAPFMLYDEDPPLGLKPSHLKHLSQYLAASYLDPKTLEKLSGQFVEASEIALHNFLRPELTDKLRKETEEADDRQYAGRTGLVLQDLGDSEGWTIRGPSSKHRYLSLRSNTSSSSVISNIMTDLLPSEAFRAWLSVVSSLAPMGHRVEARRFRKGLDYSLANGEPIDGEVRLDVCLGTTWWADVPVGSDEEDKLGDYGGWDCYMASPEEGEDPAVYQSKHAKQANGNGHDASVQAASSSVNGLPRSNGEDDVDEHPDEDHEVDGLEIDPSQLSDGDFDTDSEDGNPDEPLLLQTVSFNKLLIVLRDPGVMHFVKYLSASAPGSRWDIQGEWEVGFMEEDGDGDDV